MKKLFQLMLAGLLAIFFFAGCGSEEQQQTEPEKDAQVTEKEDNPPVIEIVSPEDGEEVFKDTEIMVQASDDNGLVQVEFFANDESIFISQENEDIYSFVWSAVLGEHVIKVVATDSQEQTAEDQITLIVNCLFTNNGEEICDGKDNNCDGEIDEGCDCVDGQRQACGTSDVGECQLGEQECIDGQWSECAGNIEPIEELCDAKDNDCDSDIDEDFFDLGKSCVVGVGECQNSGKYICSEDKKSVVCDAKPLEPQEENCADDLDNDCDAVVNNGCPCQTGEERQCGETDTGECKFGIQHCINGQWDDKCEGEVKPVKELCDGKDNDCDGQIDEDFSNLGQPCSVGVGACENVGEYICSEDQKSTVCSVTEALPPDCAGKECGDDGCEGSCGSCGNNEFCNSGICECDYVDCNGACCNNDQTCYSNSCCTPKTCFQQGYECDSQSNTCGGIIDCGSCQTNASCASGLCQCDYVECDNACCDNDQTCYSANCCTPKTCSQQGYECGGQTDTCGNTISCGNCGSNEECKNGKCRCEFEECGGDCCDDGEVCDIADSCCLPNCAGKECGDDGCGGSCGTCEINESCNTGICECDYVECNGSCCSSGQVCYSGACCAPQTCVDQSYECDIQSDTCGGTMDCGTCGVNESCNTGICECSYVECNGSCCANGQVCYSSACCTPQNCVDIGKECGSGWSDTCGGTMDCGTCGSNESCNSGLCECDYVECNGSCCSSGQVCYSGACCAPQTCVDQSYECGSQSDTCGGILDCGSCDDGLFCTIGELCQSGICTVGTTRNCDDGLFCTGEEICNEDNDFCESIGNPCPETECNHCNEDSNSCFDPTGTVCGDSSSNQCDDPDTCNGSGVCLSNYIAAGTSCDDGLFCTISDVCDGGGFCDGTIQDCGDSDNCTSDYCNEDTNSCEYTSLSDWNIMGDLSTSNEVTGIISDNVQSDIFLATEKMSNVNIYRWDSLTDDWIKLSGMPLDLDPANPAIYPSIAGGTNKLFVDWVEGINTSFCGTPCNDDFKLYVKKFNGTAWTMLGGGSLNYNHDHNVFEHSIITDDSDVYVAWYEQRIDFHHCEGDFPVFTCYSGNIFVKYWDGFSWSWIGNWLHYNSSKFIKNPKIELVNGQPVVAWIEGEFDGYGGVDGESVIVAKWDGSAWSHIGIDLQTFGKYPRHISLTADSSDNLYLSIVESGSIKLLMWNGSIWTQIGSSFGSNIRSSSVAISPDGVITVFYRYYENYSNKGYLLKKFNGTNWQLVGGSVSCPGDDTGNIPYSTFCNQDLIAVYDEHIKRLMILP